MCLKNKFLQNRRELNLCQAVCNAVICSIADRVKDGEPEPDVDNFENLFSLLSQSIDNSAASSPNTSPYRPSSDRESAFPQLQPEPDSKPEL